MNRMNEGSASQVAGDRWKVAVEQPEISSAKRLLRGGKALLAFYTVGDGDGTPSVFSVVVRDLRTDAEILRVSDQNHQDATDLVTEIRQQLMTLSESEFLAGWNVP